MSSFLDNRKDIILDCVLTDYGRKLLAQGDGSFNIVKFAFGDDEIDYSLFDTDPGTESALRDADIMNTPVLEAMTNNAASMKSKLLTIATKNQLFLPIMKVQPGSNYDSGSFFDNSYKGWAVPVNINTYNYLTASNSAKEQGIFYTGKNNGFRIDQGFDSNLTDNTIELSPDLMETEYNVIIDSRFGYLVDTNGDNAQVGPVDDDMMATYKFTYTPGDAYVEKLIPATTSTAGDTTIRGTRGTSLKFSIRPSTSVTSDAYFDRYGVTVTVSINTTPVNFKVIKTVVKVIGANTGYFVDLPVAFVKKV
jgi:hypothetical protein